MQNLGYVTMYLNQLALGYFSLYYTANIYYPDKLKGRPKYTNFNLLLTLTCGIVLSAVGVQIQVG